MESYLSQSPKTGIESVNKHRRVERSFVTELSEMHIFTAVIRAGDLLASLRTELCYTSFLYFHCELSDESEAFKR